MTELSPLQKQVLEAFAASSLHETFYWTGGTLLSAVYLHHRASQDLDFFSDKPFSHDDVIGFVRALKTRLNLEHIEEKKIHDRWEFFLHNNEELRLEFVHYDHPSVGKRGTKNGVTVDSLDDIAANKLMALVDRDEPKDVVDLYFLFTKAGYTPSKLIRFVETKFGVRLSESLVWSEALKVMRNLGVLKPLLLNESEQGGEQVLGEIKKYFNQKSKELLDRSLQ